MKKTDQNLKNLLASSLEAKEMVSRAGCPAPEELAKLFDPQVSLELKAKIVDHLFDCPACRQEFELLRLGENLAAEINKQLLPPQKSFRQKLCSVFSSSLFLKQVGAVATTLLIAFCFFYYLNNTAKKDEQVERKAQEIQNMMMFEEMVASEPLHITLSWQPAEEALFYQVEVFNQNMYLVWQSPPTTETSLRLPEKIATDLKNGSYFFWQILIFCSDERIIDSPVRKVSLTPQ
ncbi:MAG TPA: hypothetical protein PK266_06095 [Candidatus Saccharicenans sp.]|nr:hypothetical protein [Candidatus Saccharicenans sp.]HNS05934.1 hypothetical protein [Candidatus Saccharicenans sp.]HPB59603.1 hypothetical protein [Candidatus Saccharicenans sp.]